MAWKEIQNLINVYRDEEPHGHCLLERCFSDDPDSCVFHFLNYHLQRKLAIELYWKWNDSKADCYKNKIPLIVQFVTTVVSLYVFFVTRVVPPFYYLFACFVYYPVTLPALMICFAVPSQGAPPSIQNFQQNH